MNYLDEVKFYYNQTSIYNVVKKVMLFIMSIILYFTAMVSSGIELFAYSSFDYSQILGTDGSPVSNSSTLGENSTSQGYLTSSLSSTTDSEDLYYTDDGTAYKLLYYVWQEVQGDEVQGEPVAVYAPLASLNISSPEGTRYYDNDVSYNYYNLFSFLPNYQKTGETYLTNNAISEDGTITALYQKLANGEITDSDYVDAYYKYNQIDSTKYYKTNAVSTINIVYVYNDGNTVSFDNISVDNYYDYFIDIVNAKELKYDLYVESPTKITYYVTSNGTKIQYGSSSWKTEYESSYYVKDTKLLYVWQPDEKCFYSYSIEDLGTLNYVTPSEVKNFVEDADNKKESIVNVEGNDIVIKVRRYKSLIETSYAIVQASTKSETVYSTINPTTSNNEFVDKNTVSGNSITSITYSNIATSPNAFDLTYTYNFQYYSDEILYLYKTIYTQQLYNYHKNQQDFTVSMEGTNTLSNTKSETTYTGPSNSPILLSSVNVNDLNPSNIYYTVAQRYNNYTQPTKLTENDNNTTTNIGYSGTKNSTYTNYTTQNISATDASYFYNTSSYDYESISYYPYNSKYYTTKDSGVAVYTDTYYTQNTTIKRTDDTTDYTYTTNARETSGTSRTIGSFNATNVANLANGGSLDYYVKASTYQTYDHKAYTSNLGVGSRVYGKSSTSFVDASSGSTVSRFYIARAGGGAYERVDSTDSNYYSLAQIKSAQQGNQFWIVEENTAYDRVDVKYLYYRYYAKFKVTYNGITKYGFLPLDLMPSTIPTTSFNVLYVNSDSDASWADYMTTNFSARLSTSDVIKGQDDKSSCRWKKWYFNAIWVTSKVYNNPENYDLTSYGYTTEQIADYETGYWCSGHHFNGTMQFTGITTGKRTSSNYATTDTGTNIYRKDLTEGNLYSLTNSGAYKTYNSTKYGLYYRGYSISNIDFYSYTPTTVYVPTTTYHYRKITWSKTVNASTTQIGSWYRIGSSYYDYNSTTKEFTTASNTSYSTYNTYVSTKPFYNSTKNIRNSTLASVISDVSGTQSIVQYSKTVVNSTTAYRYKNYLEGVGNKTIVLMNASGIQTAINGISLSLESTYPYATSSKTPQTILKEKLTTSIQAINPRYGVEVTAYDTGSTTKNHTYKLKVSVKYANMSNNVSIETYFKQQTKFNIYTWSGEKYNTATTTSGSVTAIETKTNQTTIDTNAIKAGVNPSLTGNTTKTTTYTKGSSGSAVSTYVATGNPTKTQSGSTYLYKQKYEKKYNQTWYVFDGITQGSTITLYNTSTKAQGSLTSAEDFYNSTGKYYYGNLNSATGTTTNLTKYTSTSTGVSYVAGTPVYQKIYSEPVSVSVSKSFSKQTTKSDNGTATTSSYHYSKQSLIDSAHKNNSINSRICNASAGINSNCYTYINTTYTWIDYYKATKNTTTFTTSSSSKEWNYGTNSGNLNANVDTTEYGKYINATINSNGEKVGGSYTVTTNASYTNISKNQFDQTKWFKELFIKGLKKTISSECFVLQNTTSSAISVNLTSYLSDITSGKTYYLTYQNSSGTKQNVSFVGGNNLTISIPANSTLYLKNMTVTTASNANYTPHVDLQVGTTVNSEYHAKTSTLTRKNEYVKYADNLDENPLTKFEPFKKSLSIKTIISGYSGVSSIKNKEDLVKYAQSNTIDSNKILYTLTYTYNGTTKTIASNVTESKFVNEYSFNIDSLRFKYLFKSSIDSLKYVKDRKLTMGVASSTVYLEQTKNQFETFNYPKNSVSVSDVNGNFKTYMKDPVTNLYYDIKSTYGMKLALQKYGSNNSENFYGNWTFYYDGTAFYRIKEGGTPYYKFTEYIDKNKSETVKDGLHVKLDSGYTDEIIYNVDENGNKVFTYSSGSDFNEAIYLAVINSMNVKDYVSFYTTKVDSNSDKQYQIKDGKLLIDGTENTIGTYKILIPDNANYNIYYQGSNMAFKLIKDTNGQNFQEYKLYYIRGYYEQRDLVIEPEYSNFVDALNNKVSYLSVLHGYPIFKENNYYYIETNSTFGMNDKANWVQESANFTLKQVSDFIINNNYEKNTIDGVKIKDAFVIQTEVKTYRLYSNAKKTVTIEDLDNINILDMGQYNNTSLSPTGTYRLRYSNTDPERTYNHYYANQSFNVYLKDASNKVEINQFLWSNNKAYQLIEIVDKNGEHYNFHEDMKELQEYVYTFLRYQLYTSRIDLTSITSQFYGQMVNTNESAFGDFWKTLASAYFTNSGSTFNMQVVGSAQYNTTLFDTENISNAGYSYYMQWSELNSFLEENGVSIFENPDGNIEDWTLNDWLYSFDQSTEKTAFRETISYQVSQLVEYYNSIVPPTNYEEAKEILNQLKTDTGKTSMRIGAYTYSLVYPHLKEKYYNYFFPTLSEDNFFYDLTNPESDLSFWRKTSDLYYKNTSTGKIYNDYLIDVGVLSDLFNIAINYVGEDSTPYGNSFTIVNCGNNKLIYREINTPYLEQKYARTDDGFAFLGEDGLNTGIRLIPSTSDLYSSVNVFENNFKRNFYKYDITEDMSGINYYANKTDLQMYSHNYYLTWVTSPEFSHSYNYKGLLGATDDARNKMVWDTRQKEIVFISDGKNVKEFQSSTFRNVSIVRNYSLTTDQKLQFYRNRIETLDAENVQATANYTKASSLSDFYVTEITNAGEITYVNTEYEENLFVSLDNGVTYDRFEIGTTYSGYTISELYTNGMLYVKTLTLDSSNLGEYLYSLMPDNKAYYYSAKEHSKLEAMCGATTNTMSMDGIKLDTSIEVRYKFVTVKLDNGSTKYYMPTVSYEKENQMNLPMHYTDIDSNLHVTTVNETVSTNFWTSLPALFGANSDATTGLTFLSYYGNGWIEINTSDSLSKEAKPLTVNLLKNGYYNTAFNLYDVDQMEEESGNPGQVIVKTKGKNEIKEAGAKFEYFMSLSKDNTFYLKTADGTLVELTNNTIKNYVFATSYNSTTFYYYTSLSNFKDDVSTNQFNPFSGMYIFKNNESGELEDGANDIGDTNYKISSNSELLYGPDPDSLTKSKIDSVVKFGVISEEMINVSQTAYYKKYNFKYNIGLNSNSNFYFTGLEQLANGNYGLVNKIDTDYAEDMTSFEFSMNFKENASFIYQLSYTLENGSSVCPNGYFAKKDSKTGLTSCYYDGVDVENLVTTNTILKDIVLSDKADSLVYYNLVYNFEKDTVKITNLVGNANYTLRIYNMFGQEMKTMNFSTNPDLVYNPYGKFFKDETNANKYLNSTNSSLNDTMLKEVYIPKTLKQCIFSDGSETYCTEANGIKYQLSNNLTLRTEHSLKTASYINIKLYDAKGQNNSAFGNRQFTTATLYNEDETLEIKNLRNGIIKLELTSDLKKKLQNYMNNYPAENTNEISEETIKRFVEQEILATYSIYFNNADLVGKEIKISAELYYESEYNFVDLNQNGILDNELPSTNNSYSIVYDFKGFNGEVVRTEYAVAYKSTDVVGIFQPTKFNWNSGVKNDIQFPIKYGETACYGKNFVILKSDGVYKLYAYTSEGKPLLVG